MSEKYKVIMILALKVKGSYISLLQHFQAIDAAYLNVTVEMKLSSECPNLFFLLVLVLYLFSVCCRLFCYYYP